MTDKPAWLKPLLVVLGIMLAGSLWQAFQWLAGGARLETEITQLVPAGGMDPVNQRLYRNLLKQGTSRLVVVIEGESVAGVEAASIGLQDGLAGVPGVGALDARPDPSQLERLAEFLLPYREALLSASDRAALSVDPERAVNRWMEADPFFRPLPISQDPLGTLGRFIQEALPIPGRIDSDGFFYWLERDENERYAVATFAELDSAGIGTNRSDRLQSDLRGLFEEIRSAHDIELNASSVIFHATATKRQAKWETSVFGTLSATLIIGLLALAFRSFQPVVGLLLVIGMALLTGFAAAQRLFTDLHVLTLVMALPVIGIAVDYVIHSQVHRSQGMESARDLPSYLLRALCWCCLSSALGYAALASVDIAVLRQVSVVLVVGLVTAFLWVVALAYLLPEPPGSRRIAALSASAFIQQASRGRPVGRTKLMGMLLSLIAVGLAAAWWGAVRVVNEPHVLHQVEPELVRADRKVQAQLGLAGSRRTLVVEGRSVEQLLQRQEALIDDLAGQFGVRATGLASIVPSGVRQDANRELSAGAYDALSAHDEVLLRGEGVAIPRTINAAVLRPGMLPHFIKSSLPSFELEAGNGQEPWAALSLAEAVDWSRVAPWCQERTGCRVVDSVAALTDALTRTHRVARIALYTAILLVATVLAMRYRARGLWAGAALILVMLGGHVIPGAFGVPLTLFGTGGLFVLLGLSVDYLVFTAEITRRRDYTWLAFVLSAATTLLTFAFLLFSLTPAVRMLVAPVVAGLPLLLGTLYFVQTRLAPPGSLNN